MSCTRAQVEAAEARRHSCSFSSWEFIPGIHLGEIRKCLGEMGTLIGLWVVILKSGGAGNRDQEKWNSQNSI